MRSPRQREGEVMRNMKGLRWTSKLVRSVSCQAITSYRSRERSSFGGSTSSEVATACQAWITSISRIVDLPSRRCANTTIIVTSVGEISTPRVSGMTQWGRRASPHRPCRKMFLGFSLCENKISGQVALASVSPSAPSFGDENACGFRCGIAYAVDR